MDRQQLISFIREQVDNGKISRSDLTAIAGVPAVAKTAEESSKKMIHVFYGIGAIIAIIGVIILIAQNWKDIGFGGRIVVTAGIALATYVGGLLLRNPGQRAVSQVMFVISAVLAPIGAYVLTSEAGLSFSADVQLGTSLALLVIFGTAMFVSGRSILVLLVMAYATWSYFIILSKLIPSFADDLIKWSCMLLGFAYMLIAYGYSKLDAVDASVAHERRVIAEFLNGLGAFAVLMTGILIGGVFDLLYIGLVFAAFYASVYFKSRAILLFASLFLTAHMIKLTSEYFADSIGWPVALIGIGFLVIGIGYGTYYVNKKYIGPRAA